MSYILNKSLKWNKADLKCFALIMLAIILKQTCNLSSASKAFPIQCLPQSFYRRMQRFFAGQYFDYYEIHEAFASQVLSTLKAWEDPKFCKERLGLDAPLGSIDRSKLNVKGSSLAAGHPFAATGGRIIATAAKLINQKGSGRVLVSICAAGGQGVTAIIEK